MMPRTAIHPLKMLAALGVAFLMWGLLLVYASSPAWAATITVNSLADDTDPADGDCTLREAITAANTGTPSGAAPGECAVGSTTIAVGVKGTVNLTGPLPDFSGNIGIEGPGADKFTVRRDTGGDYGIFRCLSTCVISGITITNGKAVNGGGIDSEGEILEIYRSTISGNSAADGGGIASVGRSVTIKDSTISGNTATNVGGGIHNAGGGGGPSNRVDIVSSTISGNSASQGGGINNRESNMLIWRSTISGNNATNAGGGVLSDTDLSQRPEVPWSGETTRIVTSTISGNTASGNTHSSGGGVYNFNGLTVIEHSTITNNTAPPRNSDGFGGGSGVGSFGEFNPEGATEVRTEVFSTIVSANQGTDVEPTPINDSRAGVNNSFVSEGYNLIGDGTATGAFNQTGDQVIGDDTPGLEPLADNGGPTQTHALQSGSLALDAGPPPTSCPRPFDNTYKPDQRGVLRPLDGNNDGEARCDIGSFEIDPVNPRVSGTNPKKGATGVLPKANVKARFFEAMDASTINAQTFKLFEEGTNIKVAAAVSYDVFREDNEGKHIATLNPTDPLQSGVTYRAVVTTGAEDVSGNPLDQKPDIMGNQKKSWTFTVS